jgi:hypothetical protein
MLACSLVGAGVHHGLPHSLWDMPAAGRHTCEQLWQMQAGPGRSLAQRQHAVYVSMLSPLAAALWSSQGHRVSAHLERQRQRQRFALA